MVLFFILFIVLYTIAYGTNDVPVSVRPTCTMSDANCMNRLALQYTNNIRRRVGMQDLRMGSNAMLTNAIKHSKVMASRHNIFHQPIGQGVYVGSCRAMLTGENVAQNFMRQSADAAALCVEQWRTSPPHYENIVNRENLNMVVGIYIDGANKIWCTQIFSQTPPTNGCAVAKGGNIGAHTQQPKQTKSPTDWDDSGRPVWGQQRRQQRLQGFLSTQLVLLCNGGRCKKCENRRNGRCWWA